MKLGLELSSMECEENEQLARSLEQTLQHVERLTVRFMHLQAILAPYREHASLERISVLDCMREAVHQQEEALAENRVRVSIPAIHDDDIVTTPKDLMFQMMCLLVNLLRLTVRGSVDVACHDSGEFTQLSITAQEGLQDKDARFSRAEILPMLKDFAGVFAGDVTCGKEHSEILIRMRKRNFEFAGGTQC